MGSSWATLRPEVTLGLCLEVVHACLGAVLGPSWGLWIQKFSTDPHPPSPLLFRRGILVGVRQGPGTGPPIMRCNQLPSFDPTRHTGSTDSAAWRQEGCMPRNRGPWQPGHSQSRCRESDCRPHATSGGAEVAYPPRNCIQQSFGFHEGVQAGIVGSSSYFRK